MAASILIHNVNKCIRFSNSSRFFFQINRKFSSTKNLNSGVVLGIYQTDKDLELTKTAKQFNEDCDGKLSKVLKIAGRDLKNGDCRLLYDVVPGFEAAAICCIGKKNANLQKNLEECDVGLENLRNGVANGVSALKGIGETDIHVDPCGNATAAAEASYLSTFSFNKLKSNGTKNKTVSLKCLTRNGDSTASAGWSAGKSKANGQNFARILMETPSNLMTPKIFTEAVQEKLAMKSNVQVIIRNKDWIEKENMRSFLCVAQGSAEAPYFLEIVYKHPDCNMEKPIALVGKGVTFDSGGISIKPAADMDKMRGDMGGAACVAGTMLALSLMKTNTHVHAFIPLCENMPGGRAIKPGDVVKARNGKTIEIDNTDAEGRLILADALNYAETVTPEVIVDAATLTGAIDIALGSGATGLYATQNDTWEMFRKAAYSTGDRVWRMPLFELYQKHVTDCHLADVNNIGKYSRAAGSCTAAAFLKEFVTISNWVHLDIAGVMYNKDEVPYLGKGMSGRPTRTMVEFIREWTKSHQANR